MLFSLQLITYLAFLSPLPNGLVSCFSDEEEQLEDGLPFDLKDATDPVMV